MKLPEFSDDASPEFADAAQCKEWLQREPLGELDEFNRFPAKPAERLAVMETVREAVHFVQVEQVKRFANRALPMTEAAATAFDDTIELWASKLEVEGSRVDEGEGLAPLVADLEGEACPERIDNPPAGKGVRYLDTRGLAKSLRNRVGLLRKGETPAKLALGEDCVQPSCEQQLVHLYRQWCQARPGRGAERKRAPAAAQVCNDFAAIHYYIGGKGFHQPVEQKELTQKEREQIATFGRVSTREDDDYSNVHGFLVENWEIEDESAQGLRIVRRAGTAGKRYGHGQLVAVRPADAKSFMLGQVRWLMGGETGDLHAGLKLLAGVPGAVSVRPTGLNVQSEKFVQALSLGAVAALNQPTTLVLPTGWFK